MQVIVPVKKDCLAIVTSVVKMIVMTWLKGEIAARHKAFDKRLAFSVPKIPDFLKKPGICSVILMPTMTGAIAGPWAPT